MKKVFKNRKGIHENKGKLYWSALVKRELRQEHHMSVRERRRYWGELHTPIDPPQELFSRWLKSGRKIHGKNNLW